MAKTIRKQHSEIQKVHSETITLGHAYNQINKTKSLLPHFGCDWSLLKEK